MRRVVTRSSMRKTKISSDIDDGNNNNNMSSVCWLDSPINTTVSSLSTVVEEPDEPSVDISDQLSIDCNNNNNTLPNSPYSQTVPTISNHFCVPSSYSDLPDHPFDLPDDPSPPSHIPFIDSSQSIITVHPTLTVSHRRKRFTNALAAALVIPVTVIIYRILHRSIYRWLFIFITYN